MTKFSKQLNVYGSNNTITTHCERLQNYSSTFPLSLDEIIVYKPTADYWAMNGYRVWIPEEYSKGMNVTALERFFKGTPVQITVKPLDYILDEVLHPFGSPQLVVRVDDYETLYTKFDTVRDTIKEMLQSCEMEQ